MGQDKFSQWSGCLLDGRLGFDFRWRHGFFISPLRPDLLWGPPPWTTVLQKRIVVESASWEFPPFHGTRWFITVFTRARLWTLSYAIWIKSSSSHVLSTVLYCRPICFWVSSGPFSFFPATPVDIRNSFFESKAAGTWGRPHWHVLLRLWICRALLPSRGG